MIVISPTIQAILNQPSVSPFYFVKTSGGLRKTTYPNDLEFNGETFVSDGSIVSVQTPKMTSVVDKQKFKLAMADTYMDFAELTQNGLVGQLVEVWMSFVNPHTGQPIVSPVDVVLIYKGTVDAPSHQINTSDGGSTLFNLDCSSPMGDLDRVRTYYASQDYSDKNHPGDTSYEQIFQGSGPVAIRWGKG